MLLENHDPLGGPREIYIGTKRVLVEHGESVEVDDELGSQLLEQSTVWRKAGAERTDRAPSIVGESTPDPVAVEETQRVVKAQRKPKKDGDQ